MPIPPELFDDLTRVATRLGLDEPWALYTITIDLGAATSVTKKLEPRKGFEKLRDIITRHRRAWAEESLSSYLRVRWERDVRMASRGYHQLVAAARLPRGGAGKVADTQAVRQDGAARHKPLVRTPDGLWIYVRRLRQFLRESTPGTGAERTAAVYHRSFTEFLLNQTHAGAYWCEAARQQQQIIGSYNASASLRTLDCTQIDVYGLRYLPIHLAAAGMMPQLTDLLFNYSWLQSKVEGIDLFNLIDDYALLRASPEAALVRQCLEMSAHVVATHPEEPRGQIVGRLMMSEALTVRTLVDQAMSWPGQASLRPL